jgi:tRNA modification GTPase
VFDTIAAIATAPGRGGIGVIRVSGVGAKEVAAGFGFAALTPRVATYGSFRDASGALLDRGLVLFFPAPASYTGEDTVEFHGHGGQVVMRELLACCLALGARLARPGEFTERAFRNGKLSLAEAEAVVDLIDAATGAAVRSAARSLAGEFSRMVAAIVENLVTLRMHVEACIDFPEEEIDAADRSWQDRALGELVAHVRRVARQGQILRDGLTVALVGRPNVGKSSLLNALAGDEVAIVSPVAGTTRDPVRAHIAIDGVAIHLVDTAGLRQTVDPLEQLGLERTRLELARAAVILEIVDASDREARVMPDEIGGRVDIRVFNKIDLSREEPRAVVLDNGCTEIFLSAKSGVGVGALRSALLRVAGVEPVGESVFMARARHLVALDLAEGALIAARSVFGWELKAEELRRAHLQLQQITGDFSADDLLGEIFGRFCIGK